jgi:thiol-disulfide isomerase/thioredoxin
MRQAIFLALGALCVLASGCLGSASPDTQTPVTTATAPKNRGQPDTQTPAKSVSVEIRSWSEFQEWVATQKGKVVVVDVWSTSCGECVEEFPHFVELHNRLGEKLVCASFNIDFYGVGTPEELKTDVLKFLTGKNATGANFLSSTADENVMETLDVASIPAALIYDQSGKLKKTFRNDNDDYGPDGFNYREHINPFIEELLKSAG